MDWVLLPNESPFSIEVVISKANRRVGTGKTPGRGKPEAVEFQRAEAQEPAILGGEVNKETSQCDLSSCTPNQGIGITACASSE